MSCLLLVHAHPDDETLATGITMASYAAAGHRVRLVTCTLGEEGEVIPPSLRHLAADRGDRLGAHRREELRRAMAVLGVEHELLGDGAGVAYRDSGMAGMPSGRRREAFVNADLGEAAGLLAGRIADLAPDVVVTYERYGGYGHPDHIQAHRVTMAALRLLGSAAPPALGVVTPLSWAREDRAWLAGHVREPGVTVLGEDAAYPPSVVPDEVVTHAVADPAVVPLQAQALRAHATQVSVFDGFYALSNAIAARLSGREAYARLDPATGEFAPRAGVQSGLLPW
ncbi:MAG TPA: N-acetyl-1-D-myo-inositol-2-amino-2-deoxy-alpha-D-glucopyranoside deacetylase [Dermatophilaceae bacterium]|nr:N-acetyl-1-D-myo-inositol-2-amino-2-deoxy-alpha-D-glucopyranoside deacetylase [Dermatophilaceae bacterium]